MAQAQAGSRENSLVLNGNETENSWAEFVSVCYYEDLVLFQPRLRRLLASSFDETMTQ